MFAVDTTHEGMLGLPTHFGSDLLAVVVFGIIAVALVAFGTKVIDWIWKKLDLEEQVQAGNLAAGVVMGSVVIGLCYVMAQVVVAIIG